MFRPVTRYAPHQLPLHSSQHSIIQYFILYSHSFICTYIIFVAGFNSPHNCCMRTRGDVVVKALRYKPVGGGFHSPMVSLEFFSNIILPVALWLWGRLSL